MRIVAQTHSHTCGYVYTHNNKCNFIKFESLQLIKLNTYRSVLGHVISVVTAVLPYCLISYSQAKFLRVRPMSERQRAQLWDSMGPVVAMATAKWCPNDLLSHSPATSIHFPAIVQLPLVHTFPLILCLSGKK